MATMPMDIESMRLQLLANPFDGQLWAKLAALLLLEGDTKASQFSTGMADSLIDESSQGDQEANSLEVEILHDIEVVEAPSSSHSEPPRTLDEIAAKAAVQLEERAAGHIVLTVSAGTIVIASKRSMAQQATLILGEVETHIQSNEQLIYRDPATGVRLTCLSMHPIRLMGLKRTPLEAFRLRLGEEEGPLLEEMPELASVPRIQIESWDGNNLSGWVAFAGANIFPRTPNIVALLDGVPLQLIDPSDERLDVMEAVESNHSLKAGFHLINLSRLIQERGSSIEFRDPITHEIYTDYFLDHPRPLHDQIFDASKGFSGFSVERREGQWIANKKSHAINHQFVLVNSNKKLDILVPVYKNWSLTRQCLEALTASVDLAKSEREGIEIYIHATNDCSPDTDVNENLPQLCRDLNIILHINRENLGFIRTVNNFMLGTDSDILLVNSDVIISKQLIAKFLLARDGHGPELATLTTFSNNATIFSYPFANYENAVSSLSAIERIADAFAESATETGVITHQIPVSHGFLMYLTRTAIKAVGEFDEYFGLGYGEEVDWANRASLRGFQHHICVGTYAFHKGSASFGTSTRLKAVQNSNTIILDRYPYYDDLIGQFVAAAELLVYRNRASLKLLQGATKPLRIHITHASGGGIDKYINDLIGTDPDVCHLILRTGRSYENLSREKDPSKQREFTLTCTELDAVIAGDIDGTIVPALKSLSFKSIDLVLHSFVGWRIEEIESIIKLTRDEGIAYQFIGHDYIALCPRVKLVDAQGRYCGVGESSQCSHCLRSAEPSVETKILFPLTNDIDLYRRFFADILADATYIRCSTQQQEELFRRQGFTNLLVEEPFEPSYSLLPLETRSFDSSNIVIIGGIGFEKGAERLFQVASISLQLNPSIHFYLIGAVSTHEKLINLPNFTHVGSYAGFHQLHEKLNTIDMPIAFFPGIWPETWCYTLSEVLSFGIPLIAPDIGAIGSRLAGRHSPMVKLYLPSISDYELAQLVCNGSS
ncbi:MAG: glycosyltransferase [Cyanobacteriota bacterium]|jgi:GT2 family glycosyltransferase